MPDASVPPRVPLVPLKLLPWCWSSEGVSLSKSVHGPFKRNCLGLQKFLPLTQYPLVLQLEATGTYLPGTGTLGWGAPEIFLQIFIGHMWVWGQPILRLLPVWMDVVASLIPWLQDLHSTWFLLVWSDGCSIVQL